MRGVLAWSLLPFLTLAVAGCSGDLTEIVVLVDSDLRVPAEMDAVRIVVTGLGPAPQDSMGSLSADGVDALPRTLGLVHDGGSLGPIEVRAIALRGGDEAVSRTARVSFIPGRTVVLRMFLYRACVGEECPDGETCAEGGCRTVDVDPGELYDWPDGIDIDAAIPDGGGGDACGEAELCNGIDDDCDTRIDEGYDLSTDAENCGACGNTCAGASHALPACVADACVLDCDDGWDDCDASTSNGCEANLTDATSCGSCGVSCGDATPACGMVSGGARACVTGCTEPVPTRCGDTCVDIDTDARHCGTCDNACPGAANAAPTCGGGVCGLECLVGWGDCDAVPDGVCETPLISLTDCMGCGVACSLPQATATCALGSCDVVGCAAGWGDCNADPSDGCEATLNSVVDCGMCGTACAFANGVASCATGSCDFVACGAGFGDCNGTMTDGCETSLASLTNCGGCGVGCLLSNATAMCAAGSCAIASCNAGWADCNGEPSDGCETPTNTVTDCGGCGVACDPARAVAGCSTGSCAVVSCDVGWDDCNADPADGCEADLATDSTCGSCGTACGGATPICDAGACAAACPLTRCGASCVDTTIDTSHCGACGNACSTNHATPSCGASTCSIASCDAGWADCVGGAVDGCETSLATLSDCGACGVPCDLANASESCTSGACTLGSCAMGFGNCNGLPADGCETPLVTLTNCGGCGVACSLANATPSCASGACEISSCAAGWDDCDMLAGNGCETSLDTLTDCGGCGTTCSLPNSAETCATGICEVTVCDVGWGDCDGLAMNGCEQPLNTLGHCGGCGVPCSLANATETCATGMCAISACDPLFGDCDMSAPTGCETPLNTLADCATCGMSCALPFATESCTTGVCSVMTCDADRGDCDVTPGNGCEVDLASSNTHCGMCGMACGVGSTCLNSTCRDDDEVLQVTAGGKFSCGRQVSGNVLCWGDNGDGQLGDGTTTDRDTPVMVSMLSGATQVTAGELHACALVSGGQVWCWGRNDKGQLGDGTTTDRTTPVRVTGLGAAVHVSAGTAHACAVLATGQVYCWGDGGDGRLGNGGDDSSTPVAVAGLPANATEVAGGGLHTCTVLVTGQVWCWGKNDRGQLGDSGGDSDVPVQAGSLNNAVTIAAGEKHSCALRSNDRVACWGDNGEGQLGTTGGDRSTPQNATGLNDAVQVDAGLAHTCATRVGGGVSCWGKNNDGQLGDGTSTRRFVPTAVSGLTDGVNVGCGDTHTCAARATGGVSCWGRNDRGQLGDGSTTNSRTPVSVSGIP